jgi:membrane protease YdiL (CAAX protease family)
LKGLEWAGVATFKSPPDALMPSSIAELPIAIPFAVLLAPMAQELIFRGLFLEWLRHRIPSMGAAISLSIGFALVHNNHFKSGAIAWVIFSSRFLLGVAASYLALRMTRIAVRGIIIGGREISILVNPLLVQFAARLMVANPTGAIRPSNDPAYFADTRIRGG